MKKTLCAIRFFESVRHIAKEVSTGMSTELREIQSMEDAERLSASILSSIRRNEEATFNPFRGSLFLHPDGTITFMGKLLNPEEVSEYLTRHVWENRKKLNKEIRKWKLVGPHVVDCGC